MDIEDELQMETLKLEEEDEEEEEEHQENELHEIENKKQSRKEQQDAGSETDEKNAESIREMSDKEAEQRFVLWYEEISAERMKMLEAEDEYKRQISEFECVENGYRKRIKELEENTTELVKAFEASQAEIGIIRSKYEPKGNSDLYVESYEVVSKERTRLLNAEKNYKNTIRKLEAEIESLKVTDKPELNEQTTQAKVKSEKKIERLVVITSTERMEMLEKENRMLKSQLEKLERGKKESTTLTHVTETKIEALQTLSVRRKTIEKLPHERFFINKKSVPTFLPRIESVMSVTSSTESSDTTISSRSRSASFPSSQFTNGYSRTRYKKLLKSSESKNDVTSSTGEGYNSLSKYLL